MGNTIKGQNLRVLVGTGASQLCIAMATSCQLHLSASLEDSSTKDSTGDWQEQEVVGLSWDASTDSLVTTDTDASGKVSADLFTYMINKTLLTLVFDVTNGTKNRTTTNSTLKRTGTCYISDISVTAQNRTNSTMTVSFVGTGALA